MTQRKKPDPDATHPLPPAGGVVHQKDLPSIVIPIESYDVGSWCPTPDGTGKPEQVHLTITPAVLPEAALLVLMTHVLDAKKFPPTVLRFKSAGELRRFIGALSRHLADVWPEAFE